MKEKTGKSFPGQKTGIIQFLIKHSTQQGAVQLQLELDFVKPSPNSVNN